MLALLSIFLTAVVLAICSLHTLGLPLVVYWFLVFFRADKRAGVARSKIASTLMRDEKIIHQAIQKRPYALLVKRRAVLTLTDSRVIMTFRGLWGGFISKSFQWKNIEDVQISENMFPSVSGTNLKISYFLKPDDLASPKETITAIGIPSDDASNAYAKALEQTQAWHEKRRVRVMEQDRASAGGTYIATTGLPQSSTQGASVINELDRAKKLLDDGVISDVEFQELKSKVLNRNI